MIDGNHLAEYSFASDNRISRVSVSEVQLQKQTVTKKSRRGPRSRQYVNLNHPNRKAEAPAIQQRPSWCILKPGTSLEGAIQNVNFICDHMNCDIIREGGPCFLPEDVYSHASAVMNQYHQHESGNAWDFNFSGTGLITINDPSYGSCVYAASGD